MKDGYETDSSIASTSSNVNALMKDQFDYILESLNVDGYELMDAIQGYPRLSWRSIDLRLYKLCNMC